MARDRSLHLPHLEARVRAGHAFSLEEDFAATVQAMPADRPERQRLELLEEALRRDLPFIAHHAQDYPQALFQCLWNSAWWHDCPEAAFHYEAPSEGWKQPPPWERPQADLKLGTLLERWRTEREAVNPGFFWLRSMSPPPMQLGPGRPATLRGHKDVITCVAFSPDGRRVLSGSDDNTVRLWDAANGRELAVLRGHEARIYSAAFSPDGRHILSGSLDNTARLWDAESGRERAVLRGHKKAVTCVAFSPDGRRVLTGSLGRTVRLWDAENGCELAVLRGHEHGILCATFSPDGRRLVSGSGDMKARLWDAANGNEGAILRGHGGAITTVAFSPDGRRVLTGSGHASFRREVSIRLWDAETGRELAILPGHLSEVTRAVFTSDGRRIISTEYAGRTLVWDAETGRCLSKMPDDRDTVNWHASVENGETLIRSRPGAAPEARFPEVLRHIQSSSSGRIWAGALNNQLVLLRLEGGNNKTDAISPL